jgi:hypothetical protein
VEIALGAKPDRGYPTMDLVSPSLGFAGPGAWRRAAFQLNVAIEGRPRNLRGHPVESATVPGS